MYKLTIKKIIATTFTLFYIIPCYSEQMCSNFIPITTAYLVDNKDGTISDPETGLMWKKCSEGQTWSTLSNTCTGSALTYNWQAALQHAKRVNEKDVGEAFNHFNWRVPNINELDSIVEIRCESPSINLTFFPLTPSASFGSSSASFAPSMVVEEQLPMSYVVDFAFGGKGGGSEPFDASYLRLVRN